MDVQVICTCGTMSFTDSAGNYSIYVGANDSVFFFFNNRPTQKFSVASIRDMAAFDISIQMQCADVEVMSGYLEPGFERLLRLVQVLEADEQKMVKDRLLELFALVDPADPRVIKARAQLANALF